MAARASSLARGRIRALCGAGLDATRLRRELRAPLERLIGFDAYCINVVDPESRLVTSSIGDGLSAHAGQRLFALEARGGDFNPLATLTAPVTIASGIHVFTAKDHVKALFAKTRACDRAEFARRFS